MGIDAVRARSDGPLGRNRSWCAAAVGAVLGLAVLSGCGAGSSAKASPVSVVAVASPPPADGSVALQETVWQLVQVRSADGLWWARPNLDSTLVVDPDGRFLLRACNNVFGAVVPGPEIATFEGGTATWRRCPGTAGRIDGVVADALRGRVAWAIRDRSLELHHLGSGTRLQFRAHEVAQPPMSAVPVATVDQGRLTCRVLVGATTAGDRLYALARTRPGGPWRLIPGGPAAPGEGPMLASQLLDEAAGRRCVTGFAPAGVVGVAFAGGGSARDLELHRVPGIAASVYVGVVPTAEGVLRARDGAGRVLASWSTSP